MILTTLLFLAALEDGPQRQAIVQIVEALDQELREPESLRDLQICEIKETDYGWITTISYRARNGFGGYNRQVAFAKNEGGRIEIDTGLSRMPEFRDIYERQVDQARNCPEISVEEIDAIRAQANG